MGIVNFLSLFCPEIQKLLKPIYDLIRKGRQFIWEEDQQLAFEEVKNRLIKPPVLDPPDSKGRLHLYSDTNKFATGSALYQIQNGKPKLIAYNSKRLPEAARNYSITELEMCGLAINIASFVHLLKKVDFNAIVYHIALMHIIKSKAEPTTTRIKRLLDILRSYSFNLYYIKGKDMILSNFLSRQRHDDSNTHEIIPIYFNMQNILWSRYYDIGGREEGKYLVQIRSQAASSGITLPEVHGVDKEIDPNILPEKQVINPIISAEVKGVIQIKPRLGQGRSGIKQKNKLHVPQLLIKPIIQLKERPISQQPQNIVQPKITLKILVQESS